ncbi:MAG: TadE/TadG family type IV pilus assembly protein [bacterium]
MIKNSTRRFSRNKNGIAAIEFALVAPVLILMLLGVIETTDAYIANKKVQEAADLMSNLVSQQTHLTYADAQGVISAGTQMMSPYGVTGATITVTSVVIDNSGTPVVSWSFDQNYAQVYTVGSTFTDLGSEVTLTGPSGILEAGSSLLVTKITFPFTSSFSSMTINNLTFKSFGIAWPRTQGDVSYCDNAGTCYQGADVM